MNSKVKPMIAVMALALTGCAGIATQPSFSHASPASPKALEGSYPAAAPILMAGTNFAMRPPAEEQTAPDHGEMKMKMDMDKPMPNK